MEIAITLVLVLALLGAVALGMAIRDRRLGAREDRVADAWTLFELVAAEVGGLVVVADPDGWPQLNGIIDGITVEIDGSNFAGGTFVPRLGMRCHLEGAAHAPNAAVWIGESPALHTEFGRPRPLGDPDGIFDVHSRTEPSPSDWWQEPGLHEALACLPGAGLLLVDGELLVVFDELDAEFVRVALQIPTLIERGVERVTVH